MYPKLSWFSDSLLTIGRFEAAPSDVLHVTNTGPRALAYLLIETYQDKFVFFDVDSGAALDIPFTYVGRLSADGALRESGARWSDAVELLDNAAAGGYRFSITIKEDTLTVASSRPVRHVTCCAVDRPDIRHD